MKQFLLALLLTASLATIAQDKPKTQCEAVTTKGKQCMNPAKQHGKRCHVHDSDKPRCAGKTVKGVQCKRGVSKEGDKCYSHQFQKD